MKPGLAVLLVEDHPMMREFIAEDLRAGGYMVIEAESAVEAEEAIDQATQPPADGAVPIRLGAIVLDGRFPYGDERDATETMSDFRPPQAVVRHARQRGLAQVAFIGFSTSPMTRQIIGLTDQDEAAFIEVGKYRGGPREILAALATL